MCQVQKNILGWIFSPDVVFVHPIRNWSIGWFNRKDARGLDIKAPRRVLWFIKEEEKRGRDVIFLKFMRRPSLTEDDSTRMWKQCLFWFKLWWKVDPTFWNGLIKSWSKFELWYLWCVHNCFFRYAFRHTHVSSSWYRPEPEGWLG